MAMESSAIGLQMTLLPPLRVWIDQPRGNTQGNERSFVMYNNMMNGEMNGWMWV